MYNYKKCFLVLLILFFFNIQCFANEDKEQAIEKADLEKQISYALGYDIFDKLKENFKLDPEFFMMGAKDNHEKQPKLTQEKLRQILISYQRLARQKQIERITMESKENREKGLKFLEENKQKEGVVTLPSGLQYRVVIEGDGPLPKATDTVECHYKGTLIDGTVFDSSYQRGKPATFQVGGVIQGWIEALQMMKVGSKWELTIPPDLAYGDRGAGAIIKPGSTLIFDVEVLGIVE
ncbi:MAG: FKBP-type peptidyl-prolyl cis-trans isomerase [Desulfobacula sp.]|uniref:FKBP-type peptidyl-prolyl cis-trans isomerase n=1 Tax=Desulfobacula sp. TaxID=2593537 RepID=UPI0025BA7C73|nr:FKBP-type peptidyl-prolyl cis-trans isomerase [Desulfobacula sp.]MCD4720252.1 FKBP-type peptidyl-prolyl cis-trans isomerase [Desulfobacula sp.]